MKRLCFTFLVMLILAFAANSLFAGSFTYVNKGKPYKWKDGIVRVWFDPGPLSEHTPNELARQEVKEAWEKWQKLEIPKSGDITDMVDVSEIQFIDMGDIPDVGDIDATNYKRFYYKDSGAYDPERETVIIFDADGSILYDMYLNGDIANEEDVDRILGLTDIYAKEETEDGKLYIINGTIILNGKYWENAINNPANRDRFRAAIIHELGHLLNLDHSSVNDDCYKDQNCEGDADGWQYLPTMYRYPLHSGQLDLHWDDIIWAAYLYAKPETPIVDKFCHVKGEIFDKEGRGFQGAQVLAVDTMDPRLVRVATVTGGFWKACAESGKYVITGLVPGRSYKLLYTAIPNWCEQDGTAEGDCSLVNGINPYAPPRPLKEMGEIYHKESAVFDCEKGGQQFEAVYVKLQSTDISDIEFRQADNLAPYLCKVGGGAELADPEGIEKQYSAYGTEKKKGWCALVPLTVPNAGFLVWLIPVVPFIIRKRQY